MKQILIAIGVAVATALVGYLIGYGRGKADIPEPEIVRDTLRIRDTLVVEVDRPVTQRIIDTIEVEVIATRTVHDTVLATLPREERTYQDSSYTAIVSGIRPRLDYLAIYPEKEIVTVTETIQVPKANRWGLGLQAGYGFTVQGGKVQHAPFLGVGISYNIVTW